MIWIATLCLLALAAWLFFNGLNERRWVEAHMDDQSVVSDEGLFPKYSRLNRSAEPEGRYSINQADSKVSRMATRVKEKTANMGAAIEQKVAASAGEKNLKALDGRSLSELGSSITGSDSVLGRAADKLSNVSSGLPIEKIKPAALTKNAAQPATGPISSRIKNVRDRLDEIQAKVGD